MAQSPRLQTDWRAVLAAVACGVAVALNVGKVPIAMTQLRAEFGLSLIAAGWVASMISAIGVTSALLIGLLGDRIGALRMCLVGLGISVLGGVGALLSASAVPLLASRFCEGAGTVFVAVSAPALLSAASAPHDRRFALGMWSSYLPGGVALIMLLAPLVLPFGGWRSVWLVALGIALAAGVALWRSRAAYHVAAQQTSELSALAEAKQALAQREPWLLGLAMTSWTIQHYALIIWLPTILKEQRQLSALAVSLLSCMMVLVNVPGNLLGGYLLQRKFRRGDLIAFASVVTGLSGCGVFLDLFPDLLRYLLCLLLSFTGGLIPASVLSASASLARSSKQVGTLQGLFTQFGNLGPFFGPPAIAMLVVASGNWSAALWITVAAAVVGIVLGAIIARHERARSSPR